MSFTPVKKSAFHHKQLAIGAHMVERDGWLQSASYSSVDQESRLLNEGAGVCDISPIGKLLLQGDDLIGFLRIFSRTVRPLPWVSRAGSHFLRWVSRAGSHFLRMDGWRG